MAGEINNISYYVNSALWQHGLLLKHRHDRGFSIKNLTIGFFFRKTHGRQLFIHYKQNQGCIITTFYIFVNCKNVCPNNYTILY